MPGRIALFRRFAVIGSFQPSLRDWTLHLAYFPGVKTPGYYHGVPLGRGQVASGRVGPKLAQRFNAGKTHGTPQGPAGDGSVIEGSANGQQTGMCSPSVRPEKIALQGGGGGVLFRLPERRVCVVRVRLRKEVNVVT